MKVKRHEVILELIQKYDIQTQENLLERLKEEGFEVTQATISRDIRKLKLTKVATPLGYSKYIVMESVSQDNDDKYIRILKESYISMSVAQNLLVIKTASGMAMAFAAALDALKIKEIIGCIAGDDTIFCALKSQEEAFAVGQELEEIIRNKS